MIKLPTFPLRPLTGGPLPQSRPKGGEWDYELKWNGWRGCVHMPTRTMFNRHGKLLSIAGQFDAALERLAELFRRTGIEWWDVEALERRHEFARGTLIVLDAMVQDAPYCERHALICQYLEGADAFTLGTNELVHSRSCQDGLGLWETAKRVNAVRPQLVEGVVAKRTDSLYPFQLRSASTKFPYWVKHRFPY